DGDDGPGLGEAGRRRTARHDRDSPGRRVGVRGAEGQGAEAPEEEMIVAKGKHQPKLGKGVAFDKGRLKRLPQAGGTWEADFRALPKPLGQTETHYLGLVVTKKGGSTLAEMRVGGRPSADDLATLLANAMRRPLTGPAHR